MVSGGFHASAALAALPGLATESWSDSPIPEGSIRDVLLHTDRHTSSLIIGAGQEYDKIHTKYSM